MSYILLFCAIGLELFATTLLKFTEGFSKLYPTLGCLAVYALCFFCLSKSLEHISLSIAYATWCGLGIVATTVISILFFKEHLSLQGAIGILLVVSGVLLLNLFQSPH